MQSRNADRAQVNNDLLNLLGSMNMPIVMNKAAIAHPAVHALGGEGAAADPDGRRTPRLQISDSASTCRI